ncbi:hypothetical protein EON80_30955 [bacterium]|nr:MAG: hypothetical protein EON80_30955 [bacterium]
MDLYDVDSIEVSPDGSLLALGGPDDGGQTIVVRVRDHKILKTLTGASPLFSADGKTIATGVTSFGGEGEVEAQWKAIWFWQTGSFKLSRRFLLPDEGVQAIGFTSGKGNLLSLTSVYTNIPDADGGFEEIDNEVVFRDMKNGRPVRRFRLQKTALAKPTFSRSGHWLASGYVLKSGGTNRTALSIWDVTRRKRMYSSERFTDFVNDTEFSPNEKTLAVAVEKQLILFQLRS